MSGPPPVQIEFVTKGLDEVLKGLKSIQDHVTKTEKKSGAAAKAKATAEEKAAEKAVRDKARAAQRAAQMDRAAAIAGAREMEKRFNAELRSREKALRAAVASDRRAQVGINTHRERGARAAVEADRKAQIGINTNRERGSRAAVEADRKAQIAQAKERDRQRKENEKSAAASQARSHKASENYFKEEIKKADQSAKFRHALRERSATMAGQFAKKEADAEAKHRSRADKVSHQLGVERHKANLEIRRGLVSDPVARLKLLDSANGKSPEERAKILGQVRNLREVQQVDRSRNKAEIDLTKEVEKEEAKRKAAREKADYNAARSAARRAREEQRGRSQVAREEHRERVRLAREQKRELARVEREEERKAKDVQRTREGFVRNVAGGSMRAASGILGRVGRGLLDVGGGFTLTQAAQREVALRGQAATLASSSEGNLSGGFLLTKAREVAIQQGMDPESVLRGYDEIKKLTGNVGMAVDIMPELAKLATAYGADVGELGGLAGNVLAANPKIAKKDLLRQLGIFTQQGVVGGVEIGDFARYGSRITAGAGLFGGNKEDNEVVLGGMAQIARQRGGAASAAEATLAAQRFATDVQKKSDTLKLMGIDVRDGKGTLRNAEDLSIEMLRKTNGDVTQLRKTGLGERGIRVLTGVADIYRNAGGGQRGEQAVRDEYAKYKRVLSQNEVDARNKARLAEVDIQLKNAMEQLQREVGSKLMPIMPKLIQQLIKLTPQFVRLLDGLIRITDWALDNPFAGFAALVTGFFIKELAAAKIAQVVSAAVSGGGRVGAVANAAPVGSLGKAGKVGSAFAAVTAGVVAGALTKEWVDEGFADDQKNLDSRVSSQMEALNLTSTAKRGGLTPQEVERGKALADKLRTDLAKQQEEMSDPSLFSAKTITAGFGYARDWVTGSNDTKEAQAVEQREQMRTYAETKEALDRLISALEKNTTATSAATGAQGGAGPANAGAPNRNGPIGRRPGG